MSGKKWDPGFVRSAKESFMVRYTIMISDGFENKFDNFIKNLNIINSSNAVTVLKKEEIVAIRKEIDG